MVATAGMGEWDIDLTRQSDVVAAVMQRIGELERYGALRCAAKPDIRAMQATSDAALRRFAADIAQRKAVRHGVR